jgi:deoxyribonuclease-4
MASSLARHQDILKLPAPKKPWPKISRRVGIHTSIAGGVENAAERAWRLGCTAFQIFSSSPRQWKPYELGRKQCDVMRRLREKYDLKPLVIHANYLINLAGTTSHFHSRSIEAFRGEVERGLALCAEYLVLHPGSYRGGTREEGLARAAQAIAAATRGYDLAKGGLTVLIENTAGAEFSLGGSFDQVSELVQQLRGIIPVGACIDTCHVHVAGYDIVSEEGMQQTLRYLELAIGMKNIPVWHCNDAKAERGSKLDRHQHIGKGSIGLEPFRRLLSDPRLAHAAFIAETPIDEPGDDMRNVAVLRSLAPLKKSVHHGDTEPRRKTISD